jgi:predicted transcriptional regulator
MPRKVAVSCWLTPDEIASLSRAAEIEERPKSDVIRRALKAYVQRLEAPVESPAPRVQARTRTRTQ